MRDGTVFEGFVFGADRRINSGEVVFNTALSGYQEILSDPSYAGQIVAFTNAHIGNYGVNRQDNESRGIFARGAIIRDYDEHYSNHRADRSLGAWLEQAGISAICGLDTRKLTRHIRERGALPGAFGTATKAELLKAARRERGTGGVDLVKDVTTPKPYKKGSGRLRVTALDFGIKSSIIDHLAEFATVTVLPAGASAQEVMSTRPNGIFLSNGPGDPEIIDYGVATIKELLGQAPIFGICLGHQLLAAALGAKTTKLPFGHHGGNHPVMDLTTGKVEITSQNHNFTVVEKSLKDVAVTHRNLNDGVVEGVRSKRYPAFSVQYHPEAGPGPHDAGYLFDRFKDLMKEHR